MPSREPANPLNAKNLDLPPTPAPDGPPTPPAAPDLSPTPAPAPEYALEGGAATGYGPAGPERTERRPHTLEEAKDQRDARPAASRATLELFDLHPGDLASIRDLLDDADVTYRLTDTTAATMPAAAIAPTTAR